MSATIWIRAGAAVVANTFVKMASGKALTQDDGTSTSDTIGVALNAASADGDMICVQISGFALVAVGSESVSQGDMVTCNGTGQFTPADATNDDLLGRYIPEAVDGAALGAASGAGSLHRVYIFDDKSHLKLA